MQRFILSTVSILIAAAAFAPTAQALPQVSSDFNLQTLRLNEFDTRDRLSPTPSASDYPQSTTEAASQPYEGPTAESTQWEAPDAPSAENATVIERRQQLLDRS